MAEQLDLFPQEELQTQGSVEIPQPKLIKDAEWCFQFFNNEPVVFGWSSKESETTPLVLKIEPIDGESLTFQHNGMVFRIFAKEISEETKLERAKQNESTNESESTEAGS